MILFRFSLQKHGLLGDLGAFSCDLIRDKGTDARSHVDLPQVRVSGFELRLHGAATFNTCLQRIMFLALKSIFYSQIKYLIRKIAAHGHLNFFSANRNRYHKKSSKLSLPITPDKC